ncbi:MAG: 4-aminobutyrate aminotransferase, partial [Arthrobacter koreensis]
ATPAADEALLERRTNAYDALQSHYYQAPPRIERGWKEHLISTSGRHYLDMVNNVTSLGHGHPVVAETAARQWRRLNTNSRFHYASVAELSERLLAKVPDSFDTVLLVNSGSEAVELALRLAKAFTGREDVLCVHESYHGWSLGADAVSTSVSDNPRALETRPDWVHIADAPNAYRGRHRGEGAGAAYAADVVRQLQRLHDAGTPVGTFIAEPRNGNAGAIGTPPGYLEQVYAAVRGQGGVNICDEVQMGYGRLGRHFWGFEEHGVVPDIITMAKAMGNGHPLGAVITRKEIAAALAGEGSFFSSGGGSTLSSRIGVTVLDVIEKEQLQENADAVGQLLSQGFRELMDRHALIGAVHGMGLYQGVEFVRDRQTLEPAPEETRAICERMLELGVIVLPTGDRQNILKVKPPLCFTEESARFFLAMLDRVLAEGW